MLSGVMSNMPTLNLAPAPGSFPFPHKYIALPSGTKVTLGLEQQQQHQPSTSPPSPQASNMNGLFPLKQSDTSSDPISPLPVSPLHAQVWSQGGHVYIIDLESPFGTFVNDIKVDSKNPTALKRGDVISLGVPIPRNRNTPSYISDDQLKPIVARVALTGAM